MTKKKTTKKEKFDFKEIFKTHLKEKQEILQKLLENEEALSINKASILFNISYIEELIVLEKENKSKDKPDYGKKFQNDLLAMQDYLEKITQEQKSVITDKAAVYFNISYIESLIEFEETEDIDGITSEENPN